ncbi:hypothetical protein [Rhodopirellula bahusiensis]|uniref:hypothetical protein n=1 Tax=Rhodopirellula bahusiensis TaxID=2014065 RepID=UPI0032661967
MTDCSARTRAASRRSGNRFRPSHRRCGGGLQWMMICLLATLSAGCGQLAYRLGTDFPPQYVPNPLDLPPVPADFLWLQVVDAVDDVFKISREQPVVNQPGAVLEGRLETSYKVGGSILEPWRKDSSPGFERLQSTLQSIRRRAIVHVRPHSNGYSVEIIVQKDLEDTDRTQYATETTAGQRHDGSRTSRVDDFDDNPQTLGWIPLGRDTTLEQILLQDIFRRVTQKDSPGLLNH